MRNITKRGIWEKSNPSSKIAGFHLSSLYSPVGWFSWADAVKQFLDAKNKDNLLKVWVNTVLGETWLEKAKLLNGRFSLINAKITGKNLSRVAVYS